MESTATASNPSPPDELERESSLHASEIEASMDYKNEPTSAATTFEENLLLSNQHDDLNLPPGRIFATRGSFQRLHGSMSNILGTSNDLMNSSSPDLMLSSSSTSTSVARMVARRRSADGYMSSSLLSVTANSPSTVTLGGMTIPTRPRSRSRSRSGSPSGRWRRSSASSITTPTSTTTDKATVGNTSITGDTSSISSLEDVDQDILLDRAGLVEDQTAILVANQQCDKTSTASTGSASRSKYDRNLPSVNERLSEDTLEDVHAFSDFAVRSSNASRASVMSDNEAVLEPLDELEEEMEEDNADDNDVGDGHVIVTNMENLTMQQQELPTAQEVSGAGSEAGPTM